MNAQLTALNSCFILLLMASTTQPSSAADAQKWTTVTFAEDYRLDVEIADTQVQRALGLMHRNHLEENQGMLFVYPDEAIRSVWMKNTLLTLDVLFLSENGKIVAMLRGLQPCTETPCPVYNSTADARYMLEVNAGFIDRHKLDLGQEVIIEVRHSNTTD